jgi:hypothetical protein
VCAMSPSSDTVSKALQELAAASAQGAPPELGVRLRGAFARHHSRRRRKRVALIAGSVVCLVIPLVWLLISKQSRPAMLAMQPTQAVHPPGTPPVVVPHATDTAPTAPTILSHAAGTRVRSKRTTKARGNHMAPLPAVIAAGDFVALPSFDPALPMTQPRMVRVELTGSALQLIGYPVNEPLLERRVLTDVLVGQDGVPYAVRLVQTQTTMH